MASLIIAFFVIMSLKAGIVGLPNVGKSTLFNAITNSHVEAANYPFATINPNVGSVLVPDKRVDELVKLFNPKRTVYTSFEFTDIAGLVKGASKGEGLGNQFLSHIRDVDAIIEVVRCFESKDIIHVENSVDPIRDIEIINLELVMADLDTVQNRISKIAVKAQVTKDKESVIELNALNKVKSFLDDGKAARNASLNDEEKKILRNFNLLTLKPILYVANISDNEISDPDSCENYIKVKQYAEKEKCLAIPISCQIESELSAYSPEEKEEFLNEIGATESGLTKLIFESYKLLNLSTFFTVGADEVRAWTFKNGMKAPECAGIIHTDFQKGFIRAEVYNYDDIIEYKTEAALKEAGKIRVEGKEYIAKDSDIFFFRFNV